MSRFLAWQLYIGQHADWPAVATLEQKVTKLLPYGELNSGILKSTSYGRERTRHSYWVLVGAGESPYVTKVLFWVKVERDPPPGRTERGGGGKGALRAMDANAAARRVAARPPLPVRCGSASISKLK